MHDADRNSPPQTLHELADESEMAAAIEQAWSEPPGSPYAMDELQLLALASR